MKVLEPALSLSLKNILLTTDFSPCSEAAVKYAQAIAHRHGSRVHTIHVSGPESYQLLHHEDFALTFSDLDESSEDVTQVLRGLLQGLPTHVPLRQGEIWEVVNDVIRRNEIDLLVMATHGRTGLHRLISGSIAEEVFRNVPCPVLTIGPEVTPVNPEEFTVSKILLATDFDPNSAAPLYAVWLANDLRSALTVLNVASDKSRNPDVARAQAAVRLKSVIADSGELWCTPELIAETGIPAFKILQVAASLQPGLIILGARHPQPARINSHLPWDTAARVIAEAHCPVLTVRARDSSHYS